MTRKLFLLTVVSLFLPTVAKAQEAVTHVDVVVSVGAEDKAKVGYLDLEVEYLGDTLFKQERIDAGKPWPDHSVAGIWGKDVPDGIHLNLAKKVKLTATLGDIRGPGKHNNCILSFEVRLTTNKGNIYFGKTKEYFFDTDNNRKSHKGVEGGTPSTKFEITLQKK
jgi:hypothetical protein